MNEQILQMPMHVLLLVHKGNRVTEIHNLGKEVHKILNFAQQNSPFYMFGHNITFFLIDL